MKKSSAFLVLILLFLSLTACSSPPANEQLSVSGIYFDTVIKIDAWGVKASILEECKTLCEDYENRFSKEIETSEISQINSASGRPVTVSDETIELLEKALYYCELSGGKFDITIAPVSTLWNFDENHEGILPEQEALEEALAHVDYHNVIIHGNTVTLSDPQAQIDLGGIAKGYIADKLKEFLVSNGVEHALINLGGNVLAVGGRYDGTAFHIGIQKPFDEQNEAITQVEVRNRSVVSSGTYERYFENNGTIYHHILDPSTGYPYQNDLLQVTILSDYSADGDALSTACFALGLEEGARLAESLDGIQAIFITQDYELHFVGFDETEKGDVQNGS